MAPMRRRNRKDDRNLEKLLNDEMKIVHLRKGTPEVFPLGGSGSEGRNWRSFLRFVREGQSCG